MEAPAHSEPAQAKTFKNCLIFVTFLAFPHCFSNPHAPQLLTWEVISSTGRVAWSVSGIHTPGRGGPPYTQMYVSWSLG